MHAQDVDFCNYMHTGASYRRSRVITGPSHLGVYGPCVFIRCVDQKAKKTAQLGSKSSAFDGRVLLGLDRLGLNPVSQRHVTSGSCAGVWLIGCDPTDETDRCCSECGAAGRVRSSWRRRLYLVKSMFRVSSLIFFGCEKHCRTRPTNIEAIQAPASTGTSSTHGSNGSRTTRPPDTHFGL